MFQVRLAGIAALTICALIPIRAEDPSGNSGHVPAGSIAYQYTGRANLATGTIYGYFTQIAGVPFSALFNGTPSESTAKFTFRADVSFVPLPGNGDLGGGQFSVIPFVVAPGVFSVFFDPNPSHNWANADTFSKGPTISTIATFSRTVDQQTLIGPIAINAASATLKSSSSIMLDMRPFDLGRLLPAGVTNITTAYNAPVAVGTFALGGYGLATGK